VKNKPSEKLYQRLQSKDRGKDVVKLERACGRNPWTLNMEDVPRMGTVRFF